MSSADDDYPPQDPGPGCPKCGGKMEAGYGMLFDGIVGVSVLCESVGCAYLQVHPDPEVMNEGDGLKCRMINADVDRCVDRNRCLVLSDTVYNKRHRVVLAAWE